MAAPELYLGLDLGVASVGWAILKYEDKRFLEIVACGSRIIPQGTHRGEFERGDAITKNQDRRLQRSARRLRQRYKQRRENLHRVLVELGVSIAEVTAPQKGGPAAHYAMRAKGVSECVSLTEFGRVLWRMNSRRGYRSNRNERAALAAKTSTERNATPNSPSSRPRPRVSGCARSQCTA